MSVSVLVLMSTATTNHYPSLTLIIIHYHNKWPYVSFNVCLFVVSGNSRCLHCLHCKLHCLQNRGDTEALWRTTQGQTHWEMWKFSGKPWKDSVSAFVFWCYDFGRNNCQGWNLCSKSLLEEIVFMWKKKKLSKVGPPLQNSSFNLQISFSNVTSNIVHSTVNVGSKYVHFLHKTLISSLQARMRTPSLNSLEVVPVSRECQWWRLTKPLTGK